MWVDEDRCAALGMDPDKVGSIARRLSRAATEARAIGLGVFGGSGRGSLRAFGGGSQNEVATLDGSFDGGDGGDAY